MNGSDLIQSASQKRWIADRAWEWHRSTPWLVGCNFIPSCAVNQLEMWQADTFAPEIIDRELGLLAGLGMNSVRVFLHNLLWQQDAAGFLSRIDRFLEIAQRHGIGAMLVFFDSCWSPEPRLGLQRAPTPGVHNSYWLQSPGAAIVRDPAAFELLEGYVKGVLDHFGHDTRVHAWDVWNEPDNLRPPDYGVTEMSLARKGEIILPLIARAFEWVRSASPSQPVTSGVWIGDWSEEKLGPLHRFQISASDVVSFHSYLSRDGALAMIESLKHSARPLLCTEYMARGKGSTFEAILPLLKQEKIAAYNWGAVSGKTQTIFPWDSPETNPPVEPVPWHHDIFRPDGSPYDPQETNLIRSMTR